MVNKTTPISFELRPVRMINLVGCNSGSVNAQEVQALIEFDNDQAFHILEQAKRNGRYVPLVGDVRQIKTLVMTRSGDLFPSTVRLTTLSRRLEKATLPFDPSMRLVSKV